MDTMLIGVQAWSVFMDLKFISTDELLAGLATRDPSPASTIADWLKAAGIAPGGTRTQARLLYDKYWTWCRNLPTDGTAAPTPVSVPVWGIYMKARFQHGRGKSGYHYYISHKI